MKISDENHEEQHEVLSLLPNKKLSCLLCLSAQRIKNPMWKNSTEEHEDNGEQQQW